MTDSTTALRPPLQVTSLNASENDSLALNVLDSFHTEGSARFGNVSSSMTGAVGRIGVVIEGCVYWSGFRDVNNVSAVVARGITAFLCVAEELSMPNFVTPEDIDTGVARFLKLNLRDDAGTALQDHFARAFKFIDTCRVNDMPVVVYCKKGQSRSASIVAAYLMREYNIKFMEALVLLRRSRKADPNFAFCQQLTAFNDAPQRQLRAEDDDVPPPLALLRSAVSERIDASRSSSTSAQRNRLRGHPSYFRFAPASADVSPRALADLSLLRPFQSLTFDQGGASPAATDGNPLSFESESPSAHIMTSRPRALLDASLLTNPELGVSRSEPPPSASTSTRPHADPLSEDVDDLVDDEDDEEDGFYGNPTRFQSMVQNVLAQSGVIDDDGALAGDLTSFAGE